MKKRIMTLMTGMLLLLTACGQTGDRSASTMLPVAAVQSAAQAIAPVEDKVQEDTESLSAEETVEETKDVGDEETPNPTEDAETPSTKAEGTPSAPAGESQPAVPEQPTVPGQAEISAPQPEPAPSEAEPTPARYRSRNLHSPPNLNLSRSINRRTAGRLLRRPMPMLLHSTASLRTVA